MANIVIGLVIIVWLVAEVASVIDPKGHAVDPALSTAVSGIIGGAVTLAFITRKNGNGNGNGGRT